VQLAHEEKLAYREQLVKRAIKVSKVSKVQLVQLVKKEILVRPAHKDQ
jgi:hypothetical protein